MARNAQLLEAAAFQSATSLRRAVDSTDQQAPLGNRLLARLSPGAFKRVRGYLQPAWLLGGENAASTGENSSLLFPVQAIVSLQTVLSDGCTVEFASIGREGYLGNAMAPGSPREARRCVVQSGGLAYRLPREFLLDGTNSPGELAELLAAHDAALIGQAAILCGCYRRHALEQQVARWLLLTLDRLPGNEIVVTQEMIASLLGVRREGVTEAARRLQRASVIDYRRGRVFVLDRKALEARACECYAAIRAEFARLRE
jgi:CRP-like cAMP-binding protein